MSEQIKRGVVVEGRGSQVRVRCEDNDNVLSPWLDVGQRSVSGMRAFTRPAPGTMVAVAMDARRESGVVLGALYTDANPAPAGGDGTAHFEMPDGSTVVWEGGALNIQHASGVSLSLSGGKLAVTGDLEVAGNLKVSGSTELQGTKIKGINQVAD